MAFILPPSKMNNMHHVNDNVPDNARLPSQTAQSFKAAKSYEQSVQAFVKTSEAMINATSLFMAGRALENGGNIALQNLGQPERAADMYKRASELFMQNMTPDRAAEMLEKSAKYAISCGIRHEGRPNV